MRILYRLIHLKNVKTEEECINHGPLNKIFKN
jgi:hypothetical protein